MLGRVQVPPKVKRGETFEVRVLIQHPMETGFRRDINGAVIPAHVVDRLVCRIAGREVFSAELGTGVAANPYIAFFARAEQGGPVEVEWSDDRGQKGRAVTTLDVG
ncbi:MAG TPA: thiosulfate oxidation carrier complex protein SoxZ [Usitatibacter sp.]|nr:thiosulfate oxidation carrier complex protein SoxZ [Usitatibacter sp.]